MSKDEQRPARRRRIAGEGAANSSGPAQPRPRVVKRPVARPGSSTAPKIDDAPQAPEVEDPTPADLGEASPSADPEIDQPPEERGSRPRILAAGRRPGRKGKDAAVPTSTALGSQATEGAGEVPADEPARSDKARTASRPRLRTTLGIIVVVLALVFAVGASYWAVQKVRGAVGVDSAHAEAAAAASTASEQILSYRYDRLDEHLEDAQALMTEDFAEDFESISPALDDLAPQRQIVVEATARDAAPMPCGDDCAPDSADVLVFIDQARVADGEEQPTVFGNRISLSMVKVDGSWLVDDIEAY